MVTGSIPVRPTELGSAQLGRVSRRPAVAQTGGGEALQLVEGAEAEAKHNPTGLTKLADQAGTVRRVRARAGRLAGLGAAK
jgi:hypothetical protein